MSTYIFRILSTNGVVAAFQQAKRLRKQGDSNGNFSEDAVRALCDWYCSVSEEPVELDITVWCCDWSEYDSVLDAAEEYSMHLDDEESAEKALRDATDVIVLQDSVLVRNF